MAYDLEEQEKLDALKDWWARYGTLVVSIAVAAALSVAGWRGWQWYQGHQANQAMGYYEALENAAARLDDDGLARVRAASATLRDDFPKSGYTPRGLLIAAQALQSQGEREDAAQLLRWLVDSGRDPALAHLARLRLAGLMLEMDRPDEGLRLIENAPPEFAALYADRRGDILLAQGKAQEAAAQWRAALESPGADALSSIIQLKLDALGGV